MDQKVLISHSADSGPAKTGLAGEDPLKIAMSAEKHPPKLPKKKPVSSAVR